ncbi:MAG: pyridoxamine 5'-phosphate oxidase [Deltaproteobacteria bacterium]|nr:pyridoxamine 5'-phosphate oxidase [Deltaproteobacteria bacterium]
MSSALTTKTLSPNPNPLKQFESWFKEATKLGISIPEAMTLATVSSDGTPDARIVLLKKISKTGLEFFTNYKSPKGQHLNSNPKACCIFFWEPLARQVRIRGVVQKLSDSESDTYFQSRPRGSQIGAWCSPQSEKVPDRDVLETRFKELERQYENQEIPRPPHWGGYLLKPTYFEFWQGQDNRLHDRFAYELQPDGNWEISRLAP